MSAAIENLATAAAPRNDNQNINLIETMPVLPLTQRLKYATMAFALQKLVIWPLETIGAITRDHLGLGAAALFRPDIIKTFPARKGLPVRIFIPTSATPSETHNLPVLFTIHGGGFVLGSPPDNDEWNRTFSEQHTTLVIALNYSKAPTSPFPGPIHDLEALIIAVLSSPSKALPPHITLDTSRIALAGFSAGGNLALSLSQQLSSPSSPLNNLNITIKAVIPIYPVIDFTVPLPVKSSTRRYKPSLGGFRAKEKDYLLTFAAMFDWAYISSGQSLKDPLLSPVFVEEAKLPDDVFVIGCEMDMLCHEAWRLACRLGGREIPGWDEKVGQEDVLPKGELVLEGDEKFAWEVKNLDGGKQKRVRWLLVPDAIHGFDQDLSMLAGGDKEVMEDARIKTGKMIGVIGEWLVNGAFKLGAW